MNRHERKIETLQQVISSLHESAPDGLHQGLERFTEILLSSAPASDIEGRPPAELRGMALSQWRLMQTRAPGQPVVAIFNPDEADGGWETRHTAVALINDDMPFLVDSATAFLAENGLSVHLVVHPVFNVERDAEGALADIGPASRDAPGVRESCILFEVDRRASDVERDQLKAGLETVLANVRLAVTDWRAMLAELDAALSDLARAEDHLPDDIGEEATDFLAWMNDNHFTFLGYRRYGVDTDAAGQLNYHVVPDSGLGILRDADVRPLGTMARGGHVPPELAEFVASPVPLMITKSDIKSTIHRPVPMDSVGVKQFDETGRVIGERRFVGLFTSTAYSSSVTGIPLIRRKIRGVLERSGLRPGGHDYKALEHVLETLPRDELFQVSDAELSAMSLGVLAVEERQRPGLFIRRDPFERFISCLVYVPRERYNTDLRKRIQWILEAALGGRMGTYTTQISDSPLARLHYIIETTPGNIPDYHTDDIEAGIIDAARSWADRLREAIDQQFLPDEVPGVITRYGGAFSAAYREDFSPGVAAIDVALLEDARAGGDLALHLYRQLEHDRSAINLKIYHADNPIPLSDILPKLEQLGLRVISERPYRVRIGGGHETGAGPDVLWIHDLLMVEQSGLEIDIGTVRDSFRDALKRIWSGEAEDDGFNRLIVLAGMSWRDVVIVRAIAKYLRQVGAPFSQVYMEETLAAHAEIAVSLVRYFMARFDPAGERDDSAAADHRAAVVAALDNVASLDEDRIIRRFLNVIDATLRTNYFQTRGDGQPKPYVSFKLDSESLDELPLPRPHVEVFVYSPRVEGIHLRGGRIARGGIRWSDRREDFRTEVLGLMKAQMVKNAVIVPVGAKGGFVVKRPPESGDREAMGAEGVACYKMFIAGLLDLTDNYVDGVVVPPPDLVAHDEADPYLVVAADKGTATFSDIANGVSAEYGFWLGDAFASGGKDGYDHKKMGITARGAWESVKRHFRELGRDTQSDAFTVIGVGDMSGDVFGNGMLQSQCIRLLGAFNHRHIFLDPDPDPVASYAERERLFTLPRSSWSDYDPDVLSPGGMIVERSAKSVALTPEVRARLGISKESLTPHALIGALLAAHVDLLWFGGIGNYVKASAESHADAGDRANDIVRIDAAALNCRVVGEGANLGMTQRGRVEFALAGGLINTDAIDNSAGVDCSDHEVNIKVLLNQLVVAGELNVKQRNALLETMTDDVAGLVLRNNYLQSQALSVELAGATAHADSHERLMRDLERAGHLDRAVEFLPDDEIVAERLQGGQALTRPELAVLLASAKISVFADLIESDVTDDPYLAEDLERYFPDAISTRYGAAIPDHTLRREIIATSVANSIVNRAGCSFVNELAEATSSPVNEIAKAYAAARHVFCLRELWHEIEALDNQVDSSLQTRMLTEVGRLLERGTLWFLRSRPRPIDISAAIDDFADGVAALGEVVEAVLPPEKRERVEQLRSYYVESGVSEGVARMVAAVDPLLPACDIVEIADITEIDVTAAARAYFTVGAEFGMDWLRDNATALNTGNHWQHRAVGAITDDLFGQQRALCLAVLQAGSRGASVEDSIAAWQERHRPLVNRTNDLFEDLRAGGPLDLAMLAVANRQIRALIIA